MSETLVEPATDVSAELVRLLKLEERREPAVAQIAIWVATGIVEGRLTPGQDLNSVDLSHRFNSSRTPVREALMLLESEGLVEIRARKRPRVASFTPQRVREIYFVRRHLLALVGSLVAERVNDDEIEDLRERLGRMRAAASAGDVDSYFWGHVDLQSRLMTIAGNQTLADILDSLALRTLVLRHASLARPGRLHASVADQFRIFEAIEARDGELTAMLLSRATDAALRAIDMSLLTEPI
ncbi:GntR family transcriptional regulator [Dactylosporangium sp. CA-092794]|uniref:GntR family transcriptional regulator n=1 Tax=Dactylosporangium sp. CA-092794 TaxID=3239929 RepID=UPI003D8C7E4E